MDKLIYNPCAVATVVALGSDYNRAVSEMALQEILYDASKVFSLNAGYDEDIPFSNCITLSLRYLMKKRIVEKIVYSYRLTWKGIRLYEYLKRSSILIRRLDDYLTYRKKDKLYMHVGA